MMLPSLSNFFRVLMHIFLCIILLLWSWIIYCQENIKTEGLSLHVDPCISFIFRLDFLSCWYFEVLSSDLTNKLSLKFSSSFNEYKVDCCWFKFQTNGGDVLITILRIGGHWQCWCQRGVSGISVSFSYTKTMKVGCQWLWQLRLLIATDAN